MPNYLRLREGEVAPAGSETGLLPKQKLLPPACATAAAAAAAAAASPGCCSPASLEAGSGVQPTSHSRLPDSTQLPCGRVRAPPPMFSELFVFPGRYVDISNE